MVNGFHKATHDSYSLRSYAIIFQIIIYYAEDLRVVHLWIVAPLQFVFLFNIQATNTDMEGSNQASVPHGKDNMFLETKTHS